MDWSYLQTAIDKNVMLSINPDAHSLKGIQDIRYGVFAAQKGGLSKQHNLSSLGLAEFEVFLQQIKSKK